MLGKFVRLRNRTVMDIYHTSIQSRMFAALNTLAQNIVRDARRTHTFKNRTGALEDSISWVPPVYTGSGFVTAVYAGGWARAKFAFDASNQFFKSHRAINARTRFATTQRQIDQAFFRPNVRTQRGQRIVIKKGMGVFVDYARYVERKGYSVLTAAVLRGRRDSMRLFGRELKLRYIP